jgi:hypothetical protein
MTTLEQEVGELKARLDRLEAMVRALAGGVHKAVLPAAGEPRTRSTSWPGSRPKGWCVTRPLKNAAWPLSGTP